MEDKARRVGGSRSSRLNSERLLARMEGRTLSLLPILQYFDILIIIFNVELRGNKEGGNGLKFKS